ncbi:MAG: rhomboid family intramembrane serine protease [Anaeromyxobacteraceae bacterium]|nr:rhomboid family intramembrane serine protease [Anaeromyxobacteraceae bacterium]
MLLPLGMDDRRLDRIPWGSLGIAVMCLLVFLVTERLGRHGAGGFDLCLVTDQGFLQVGWLSAPFTHADWSHVLWNLFYFALCAPFLESLVGTRVFLVFYLAAGVLASVPSFAARPHLGIHMLGASGAISACLGAFTWRFGRRRVRFFSSWSAVALRPTFTIPAWTWGLGIFGMDALSFAMFGYRGRVGYGVHVVGFLVGVLAAILASHFRLEDRLLAQDGGWRRSDHHDRAEAALRAGRTAQAEEHLREALRERPADTSARLRLADLALRGGRPEEALVQLERLASDPMAQPGELRELVEAVGLARLRPCSTLLLAERLEPTDHLLALDLADAAVAAGGRLGARALVTGAELALRHRQYLAARSRAEQALRSEGLTLELQARAVAVEAAAGARLDIQLDAVG